MLRVLVIAENVLARTGLAALLRVAADVEIVGQIGLSAEDDLSDALPLDDTLAVFRAELLVVDLGHDPAAALPALDALSAYPLVLLLPDLDAAATAAAALSDAPAYGLLLAASAPELLADALSAVDAGLVVLDPALPPRLLTADADDPASADADDYDALTPREFDVLQLMAEGLTNKAIAQNLDISPNTVKYHINAILSKLDAQSRTEAVVRATRLGWVIL